MERLPFEIEPAPRRNQFAAALAADARRDRRLMVRGRCEPPDCRAMALGGTSEPRRRYLLREHRRD
jgi:hypothetical protein